MASAADNSVASVPLADLARLRDGLLGDAHRTLRTTVAVMETNAVMQSHGHAECRHLDANPSDTPPMESQVYRDFTNAVAAQNPHDKPPIRPRERACDNETQKSLVEGDTGFVDLQGVWTTASQADSSQWIAPLCAEQISSPTAAMPETPALRDPPPTAQTKRAPPSVARTPAYSQLFAAPRPTPPVWTTTQLFAQTQARSSPPPADAPRSDPVWTRPSPNLPRLSSPPLAASSPFAPRQTYTSRHESQELRRRAAPDVPLEEEEEDDGAARAQRRRLHRVASERAVRQLATIGAPPRPGSRSAHGPAPVPTVDLVTPAPARVETETRLESGSEGGSCTDDGEEMLDEGDAEHQSVDADNDEYDELGQTVRRSQPDPDDDDDDDPRESDVVRQSSPRPRHSFTQRSAIADSQPAPPELSSSRPPARRTPAIVPSSPPPRRHHTPPPGPEIPASASPAAPRFSAPPISPFRPPASQTAWDSPASQSPRTRAGVPRFADLVVSGAGFGSPGGDVDVDAVMNDAVMNDLLPADDRAFLQAVSSPPRKRRMVGRGVEASPTTTTRARRELVEREARELVESPAKANERPPSPVVEETVHEDPPAAPCDATPESVRMREAAGSRTVAQMISKRCARPATYGKRGKKAVSRKASPTHAVEERRRTPEVGDEAVETVARAEPEPEAAAPVAPHPVAPHRVFAFFNGSPRLYFPATLLGPSPNPSALLVRFDDGQTTSLAPHLVRPLDLRPGDVVKTYLNGLRRAEYVVRGFGPPAAAPDAVVDVHGHDTVRLQPKLPARALGDADTALIDVAIEAICLSAPLWKQLDARQRPLRTCTPSVDAVDAAAATPGSRTRRARGVVALRPATRPSTREASVSSSTRSTGSGVFAGMAFATSYGANESAKAEVTRLIRMHGGTVLEGLEELFVAATGDHPTGDAAGAADLEVAPRHRALSFVALLADRHSRRVKYIQALALGLPALSGCWVTHSLDPRRNPGAAGVAAAAAPLPWLPYLLAAGDSAFLSGAVRSRSLPLVPPAAAGAASLVASVAARPRLLVAEHGVLVVAPTKPVTRRKGKGAERMETDSRAADVFLSRALGAGYVRRVEDLAGARAECEACPGRWRWVYVEGGGEAVGGKRKRGGETCTGMRVVDAEFVVQSLILGVLAE